MTGVQAFDGVIGALGHDPSKTYGPFAFAVLNAFSAGWLLRGLQSYPKQPVTITLPSLYPIVEARLDDSRAAPIDTNGHSGPPGPFA